MQHRCCRRPDRKPLVDREGTGRLGPLLGCLHLPSEPVTLSRKIQGIGQTKGVRLLLGQGDRLLAPLEGLIRIAKEPQHMRCTGEARHPEVLTIKRGMGAMLLRVIESDTLLPVLTSLNKFSQGEQ